MSGTAKYPPLRPLTTSEQDVVLANMGLAHSAVNQMAGAVAARRQRYLCGRAYHDHRRHAYDDLIDAGYIGLCVAAQRFDPSLGFRFSTFAYHWIRNFVIRAAHVLQVGMRTGNGDNSTQRLPLILFSETGAVDHRSESNRKESIAIPDRDSDSLFGEPDEDVQSASGADLIPEATAEEIFALLALWLDRRSAQLVYRHVIEGHSLRGLGEEYQISAERVRQVVAAATRKLRDCDVFCRLLERRQRRSSRLAEANGWARLIA